MTVDILSGNQTITNFNPATDIVEESNQSINAAALKISGTAAGTVITDLAGNVITLSGITNAQLTNANFNIINGSIVDVGGNLTTPALNTLSNNHTLTGTGGDQILELGGSDVLNDSTTGGGNFIRGGSGTDSITASTTTTTGDTIIAGAGTNDTINFSTSLGVDTIWASNNAAYIGSGTFAGGNGDTVTGSLGGGLLHGSTGNDEFISGANTGNETIIAGHGVDTINVDAASNTENLYEGGKGNGDIITDSGAFGHNTFAAGFLGTVGSAGNGFSLTGGSGIDNIFYGDGGNGSINAGTGINDTVYGGAGAVLMTSHSQTSSVTGSLFEMQKGNDTFVAAATVSFDTVYGGSGTDSVSLIADTAARQIDILVGSGVTTVQDTTESTGTTSDIVNIVTDTASGSGVDTYNIQLTTAAHNDVVSIDGGLKSTDIVNVTLQGSIDSNAVGIVTDTGGTLEIDNGGATHGVLDITGLNLPGTIDVTGTSGASYIHYNETGTGTVIGSASDNTNDLLIGGSGNDTIDTGTGTVQVITGTGNDVVNDAGVSVTDTITGGSGSDTIDFTGTSMTVGNLGSSSVGANGVTGFVDYKFTGSGTATATILHTLATTTVTSSDTVTIDGSAISGGFHLTSFSGDDGVKLDVLGGSGVDTISLGTDSGTEGGTITGGVGTGDTLAAGNGGWSITAGAGSGDVITGAPAVASTAGQDTISLSNETGADNVLIVNGGTGSFDSITGFHGATDVLNITRADLNATATGIDATNVTALSFIETGGAVNTTPLVQDFAASAAVGATANVLVLTGANFTQAQALTAIESGGSREFTAVDATLPQFATFILAYSDGTNTYVDAVENETADAGGGIIPSGQLISHHLVTIAGMTNAGSLTTADFAFT
jgi:hypothetical protein